MSTAYVVAQLEGPMSITLALCDSEEEFLGNGHERNSWLHLGGRQGTNVEVNKMVG